MDFRWHRSTPSPNWTILPEAERMTHATVDGVRLLESNGEAHETKTEEIC